MKIREPNPDRKGVVGERKTERDRPRHRRSERETRMVFRIIKGVLFGFITFLFVETELGIGEGTSLLGLVLIAVAGVVGYCLPRRGSR